MPIRQGHICQNGHTYYKTSSCRVCPICERNNKPNEGFLAHLAAPARRALEKHGATSVSDLACHSLKEVSSWHGIGPAALKLVIQQLMDARLSFKKD